MRFRIFCLLLCLALLLCTSAQAFTRQELRDAWQQANRLKSDASPYLETPDLTSFFPGALTEDAQQYALDCLNFIRTVAGLSEVSLDPLYSLRAQNGALLLAVNDVLAHDSPQPDGMSIDQYQSAYMGTSLGNIAKFNWMKPDILIDGVRYFVRDDGESNRTVLGHRRWLLNPYMEKTGFGLANSQSGMSYVTMYAVDTGNIDAQWEYVAWPSEGAFPVELMRADLPWSISLNADLYSDTSNIQVYLKEETSGAEFCFTPDSSNADGECTLSSESCGAGDCLIFLPDLEAKGIDEYVQNQLWTVHIVGLRNPQGATQEIRFQCEMTSLNPQDVVSVEISRLNATLAPGEVLHLSAAVIPDYADDTSVIWGSSDASVAQVSSNGCVTAIAPGECNITAMSANGRKDVCNIIVE